MDQQWRKALAEAIGTFCLVFAGAGAIVVDGATGGAVTHAGVAITFGLVVMAMIYALGDISGAHINPAVSVAFAAAGRLPWTRAARYIAAQCAGAVLAALLLRLMFPQDESLGSTVPFGPAWRSFALEVVLTFILMLVILAVSSGSKEKGLMAGIAVGGVVGLEAMFAGPISGASMNPARSLGPAIVSARVGDLWIYLAAPALGALLAVPAWRALDGRGEGSEAA